MEEQDTRERGGDGTAIATDARIKQVDNNAEAERLCRSERGCFLCIDRNAPLGA